jgi:hypothetical protein
VKACRTELSRYGIILEGDDPLIVEAEQVITDSQRTAFESHLCRSLRKAPEHQVEALRKYMALYAAVPPTSILTALWNAAIVIAKPSVASPPAVQQASAAAAAAAEPAADNKSNPRAKPRRNTPSKI